MELVSFASFLLAAICLTLAPGPDILFVLTKSIAAGTRAGICVAAGLVTGTFFHTALAAFGISFLIRQSEFAFASVKWLGVAYLVFLGISALRHRDAEPTAGSDAKSPPENSRELYFTGVLMAALNPKLIIFFLALFPQFIPENASRPTLQMLLLGFTFSVQALIIFSAVATFAGRLSRILCRRPGVSKALNVLTALVLFGIATSVAFI